MIASITGTIQGKGDRFLVVDTGGLGYRVFVTASVLLTAKTADSLTLYTYQHISETANDLYGFPSLNDVAFFELLLSISNVGPKTALGVMNVATIDELKTAIQHGDPTLLTKVSGVGRKTAERIVLELKEKVDVLASEEGTEALKDDAEVLDALVALGYARSDARTALRRVPKDVTGSLTACVRPYNISAAMDVKEWADAQRWDAFVAAQTETQFLQSWSWGEFQMAVGRTVKRIAVFREQTLVGAVQCILQRHGAGVVSLNVYRGPLIDAALTVAEYTQALSSLLDFLVVLGKQHHATYLHLEAPFDPRSPQAALLTDRPGWVSVGASQPRDSLLLDLALPDEDLLAQMHEKTRYNIRLAERRGVQTEEVRSGDAIDSFLALTKVTAARDGITPHSDAYYTKFLHTLGSVDAARLFLAKYNHHVLATNLVLSFGDTVTYVHGASSSEHRNVMAPQLLQWRQIQWARTRSARWYDFWGIAPQGASDTHSWSGITRFKKGFGGEERHYLGALEYPLQSFRYRLVRLRRSLRR